MDVELTIKNYRCFSDTHPVTLTIRKGLTSFVGINNAGKSSLLKFFYEFRNVFTELGDVNHLARYLSGASLELILPPEVTYPEDVFHNGNARDMSFRVNFSGTNENIPLHSLTVHVSRSERKWHVHFFRAFDNDWPMNTRVEKHASDDRFLLSAFNPQVSLGNLIYVHQTMRNLATTLFIGSFRNVINAGSANNYYDIQVGQAFVKQWRQLKTGKDKRLSEATVALTKSVEKIFGFDRLEINPSDDDSTLQIFVNERSYMLNELGSGLAQFIMVSVNAATRRPAYILIDEPELGLHPSLQLDFLTTIASYATEGTLFSTHSIGLARASSERVYSVRRNAEGTSEVKDLESTPGLAEFLGELGFTTYQELGFDKILLVEGPSEVKTVQQFLRALGKDHQVLLLPLGGASLINAASEPQLAEIHRISPNISALIDSERVREGADLDAPRQGFVEICARLGIDCHVLERRALENYLSDNAIKVVKGDSYGALGPYQRPRDVPNFWGKQDNWRVAREMNFSDIEQTDLGRFLQVL